jgi:hypothetical protein
MHPILRCSLIAGISLIPLLLYLFQPHFSFLTSCILIIIVFILIFTLYYYQLYKPFFKKNEDYLNNILHILFKALESEIEEIRPECSNIRINVMRVRRKILKPWKRFLKIDYYYGDYDHSELEQIYGLDIGSCGVALYENSQIFYDSILQHETLRHMTPTQRKITEHVKSTLSTPIYSPMDNFEHKPIAILNLDSIDSIDITGFNDTAIQEIAANFTTLIGTQLM